MRKGTLLYLTDTESIQDDFDENQALKDLGFDEKWTIIAAGASGWCGVEDAQRLLIARGAQRVEALKGRVDKGGGIEIFGDSLRVFG